MDNRYPEPIAQEPATQPVRKQRPVWVSFALELLQTILMAVVLYFLIDTVIGRVRVENISMKPTLHEGEFILVNKMAYRIGDYQRGDVIIFHYPRNPQEDYIKRLIGLPGDTITVEDGSVYVNGQMLDEPYISAPPAYSNTWAVPLDQLFVLGDNRNQSSDSHSWGFVPVENVVGKAMVIYWPLSDARLINQVPTVHAASPP